MSTPVRYNDWGLDTVNLAKMRPGRVHVETQIPKLMTVVLTRDDTRRMTLTCDREAARELLSGIALVFPELLE